MSSGTSVAQLDHTGLELPHGKGSAEQPGIVWQIAHTVMIAASCVGFREHSLDCMGAVARHMPSCDGFMRDFNRLVLRRGGTNSPPCNSLQIVCEGCSPPLSSTVISLKLYGTLHARCGRA
jgi:hypothetical protein